MNCGEEIKSKIKKEKESPLVTDYKISGHILETVNICKDLGLVTTSDLSRNTLFLQKQIDYWAFSKEPVEA